MPETTTARLASSFTTLGDLLKYLRRRARLSQRDLSIAVGYSESQISRLESGHRPPNLATLTALFAPALDIEDDPQTLARLLELAAIARGERNAPAEPAGTPPPHNLPVEITRLFGRQEDVVRVQERLAEWRLVTLTGPGGVGKTRLALRVAADALGGFAHGGWLVELAALSNPALVPQQVALALGLIVPAGRPILEHLIFSLRRREMLLVLDNCEHLLEACAHLANDLLRACPQVKILATSREALDTDGEAVFPVGPLPYPDPDYLPPLNALSDYAALGLLVDRARALLPDFQLSAENAHSLTRIGWRLEGIPLALELAAARIGTLGVDEVADRLDDVLGTLARGRRTAAPRHQTLRDMLGWSYALLDEAEARLLNRLSIFAGGCTTEAAEAVCSGNGVEAAQVPALLAALAGKSLIQAPELPVGRIGLLAMVRQYAAEALAAGGETATWRQRHGEHYTHFAANILTFGDDHDRTPRLVADVGNVRLALEWSFMPEAGTAQHEAGLRLFGAMYNLWPSYQEEWQWSQAAVATLEADPATDAELQAYVLGNAAYVAHLNDTPLAIRWATQATDLCRRRGPAGAEVLMWSDIDLAYCLIQAGDTEESLAALAEAQGIADEIAPANFPPGKLAWLTGRLAQVWALVRQGRHEYAAAKQAALECLAAFETIGRVRDTEHLEHLAAANLGLGEWDEARAVLLEARDKVCLPVNDKGQITLAHLARLLGQADLAQGNFERAREYYVTAIRLAQIVPDYNHIASALGRLAEVAAKQAEREPERAARLAGASQALYVRQGRAPWEDSSLDTLLPGWRSDPTSGALTLAYQDGQALSAEQAVAFAIGDVEA